MTRCRLLVMGCAVMLSAVLTGAAERTVMEAILVRVNDRIVTMSGFRDRLRQEILQLATPPPAEELSGFAERLFAAMVDELVLLERAAESRISVDESDLDRAIAGLREENNLEDDEAFSAALAQAGLTVEALRESYRRNMLIHRAVQSEVKPSEITEEELRRMYEEDKESFRTPEKVRLEQLFFAIAADESDRDQVRRRALGLIERVTQGSDLIAEATLAGVEVQDLGAIPVADLRPELLAAVTDLDANQLTEPLTLAGGYQVLRLVERVPEGYLTFEEVRETLRRRKSQMMYEAQTRGLVERLKQEYLVETRGELMGRALEGFTNGM